MSATLPVPGAQPPPENALGFDEWVAAEYAQAYRTARMVLRDPTEAADAVQDAFLRVWRFRDSLPEGSARRAWLYRVVVNACISRARSSAARPTSPLELAPEPLSTAAGPEALLEAAETSATVLAALADLPEHLRVVIVLRFWTGLSEREIATAISRRPGTVKSRMSAARALLEADPRLRSIKMLDPPAPELTLSADTPTSSSSPSIRSASGGLR